MTSASGTETFRIDKEKMHLIFSDGTFLERDGGFTVIRHGGSGYTADPTSKVVIVFGDQKLDLTEADLPALRRLIRC